VYNTDFIPPKPIKRKEINKKRNIVKFILRPIITEMASAVAYNLIPEANNLVIKKKILDVN
jgi:hypothetical protein